MNEVGAERQIFAVAQQAASAIAVSQLQQRRCHGGVRFEQTADTVSRRRRLAGDSESFGQLLLNSSKNSSAEYGRRFRRDRGPQKE